MREITLRGMPTRLHRALEEAAVRNGRSVNREILARLEVSLCPQPVDVAVLLRQIERRHATLGPVDLSPENVRRLRDEGRRL
ncbi:Arc family DNA-binding protein [Candidatus Palauibacter sp.]|uniref:Arc family DNA-binding protein n=1 Tax=Candidatus Palauibacter sp. TaxID=3101350 RepID=UPI003B019CC0